MQLNKYRFAPNECPAEGGAQLLVLVLRGSEAVHGGAEWRGTAARRGGAEGHGMAQRGATGRSGGGAERSSDGRREREGHGLPFRCSSPKNHPMGLLAIVY